ncbi:MAG: SAM-dependent methyltransferase [Halieaceae bacterium]|jgi:SAM-dependent methyltransferase
MKCRCCDSELVHTFLDLGFAPPSNAYLTVEKLNRPEKYFPLRVKICDKCWLAQTEDYAEASLLFDADYAYFSSTSLSWLTHAANFSKKITQRLGLSGDSFVIEVAANDGYLLKNFVTAGVPCLGIEPTASTASAAEKHGIEVIRGFFGEELACHLAENGQQADLVVGNNVFAHVPDIIDFARGLKTVLKPGGTVTLEFPHLMELIRNTQFDTVYHEHFSYLSLYVVRHIFERAGLRIQDVETLSTHGGSLRVYGCHREDERETELAVDRLLTEETDFGLRDIGTYRGFQSRADKLKDDLLGFLLEQKRIGKQVAGYGAAAKGNTLLNYAGVKTDLLPFVCDAALAKQGKFMPGSHIPIFAPSVLAESRPDYVLILPWNLAAEVKKQNEALSDLGTRFVTAIPRLEIL